jgi:hypothetical protein
VSYNPVEKTKKDENRCYRRRLRRILVLKLQLGSSDCFPEVKSMVKKWKVIDYSGSSDALSANVRCGGTHTKESDGSSFEIHHLEFTKVISWTV